MPRDPSPKSPFGVDAPWLVIAAKGNPTIRLDAGMLDHISASGTEIILTVGDVDVGMEGNAGADDPKRIVELLAPFTRQAPIARRDVYEDAKRRFDARAWGKELRAKDTITPGEAEQGLLVGSNPVYARGEHLYVGLVCFLISEVAEYSLAGALLPLSGGAVLQAAMASLVIHAANRSLDDDLALLAKRIAAYEARQLLVR